MSAKPKHDYREFNISKPINEHAINTLNFYHDTTDVPARK
jgi:hypothetical protein